jgi:hypothetical protein
MTNICCVGSVIDLQNNEQVPAEVGRSGDGMFIFRFRNVSWGPELKEGLIFQRVLESIQWRLQQATRNDRPAKEGSRRVGPFTIGVTEGSLWYVATPSRYTYMNSDALDWMLEVTRRAINVPREPTQLVV